MSELIISVSGLRGVIGRSLTPPDVARYVGAFAALAPPGPIVVARDGRATGALLADLVRGTLCAAGRAVLDAGVAATPTVGVLVSHLGAAGGVQISASHNPPEYNGLKLFAPSGRVLPEAAGRQVREQYFGGDIPWAAHDAVGRGATLDDPSAEHLRRVLALVDVDRIRARAWQVVLDANHGAGSVLGRRLLAELGCRTIVVGGEPDGAFAHPPEPLAENLAAVAERVRASGADIGFCQDPDADRLAIIDAAGRYLGEEYTVALCVDHVLAARPGPVVINCATSRMTVDLAEKHSSPCVRAAVGEANVVDAMLAQQAVFGGEGNGGPIDPRVGLVRDSFVGMALVLDALTARRTTIADWAATLPRYEIVKTKVALPPAQLEGALAALERHFADARADRLDGLRLDFPAAWLLVRASNTEPIVRIIAEAATQAAAASLAAEAAAVIAHAATS